LHCKYIPIRTEYLNGPCSRITYGLAAVEEQDGYTVSLASYCDLSTELTPVEELANLCCTLQPSFQHLGDLIDDFLAAF